MSIGPGHYAVLSAVVFTIGGYGAMVRREGVALLLAVAVMLMGPVIALVGFSEFGSGGRTAPAGTAFAALALGSLAAEAVVAGATISLLRRRRESTDVDAADDLVA